MIEKFAVIIGAMKSGTTSLFRYLEQHPAIAPCSQKEPHFFGKDENWERGLGWYEDLWDWEPQRHEYALEASTSCTKRPLFPDAAARMAETGREFKLIYCLRDPLDRIESHLAHAMLNGWVDERTHIRRIPAIIETTRYAAQLRTYRRHFSDDEILLVNFADLVSEPDRVVERICEFLEVDTDVELAGLGEAHNRTKSDFRDSTPSSLLKKAGLLDESTIANLPGPLREGYRAVLQEEIPSPELSEAEREWVRFTLAGDTQLLEEEYGFDTGDWLDGP